MAIDIGRIAYQKYSDEVNEDLPKWETIGKVKQDGWRAAAVAVLQYIDKERESLDIID